MGLNSFDLSSLSDDEIETLLIDLILEAYTRGGQIALNAIYKADEIFNQATTEEKTKASTLAAAFQKNLSIKKTWEDKRLIANKLFYFFNNTDITLSLWSSEKERRVYLYKTSTRTNTYKGDEIAVLYFTGNANKPPLYLETYIVESKNKDELIKMLAEIAEQYIFMTIDVATLV
ncbi:MAG TPA: hypothetical protein VGE24_14990 [Emticicia sp.]